MAYITKESFEEFVNELFPGRTCKWDYDNGRGYMYIQAGSGKKFSGSEVHYEFNNCKMRLHIEGERWKSISSDLFPFLNRHDEIKSEKWQGHQNCQWVLYSREDDIFALFKKISSIIEPELAEYEEADTTDVVYESLFIYDLLKKYLTIPSYQRIYVWKKEQVLKLLDDIVSIGKDIPYHMGAVILHEHKSLQDSSKVDDDIVDGQQRIVTISLIIKAIYGIDTPDEVNRFLGNKYVSNEAIRNIRANYEFIKNYLKSDDKAKRIRNNLKLLLFSVLTIKNSDNLDLAFTFFSNTNSRGKKLSDYDLLKPHHLRYISSDLEEQQMHLAKKWDSMILGQMDKEKGNRKSIEYVRVIEMCLYRLRKWNQYHQENLSVDHYIKKEFEAALIIPEVPPFGEQFNFNEPIQGGQHFFAYVEHFINLYKAFDMKDIIHNNFGLTGSNSWYGNVVEALVFCYYLRFGNSYISEAMLSILRYVSVIRFNKGRAYEPTILEWVKQSRITMLILQATSPTFFLAEMESMIEKISEAEYAGKKGVRHTFYQRCKVISDELNKHTTINYYNDYFNTRYGRISI